MITKIISGNVIERRKSRITRRPVKRGGRIRGNSSEKKIEGNKRAAILALSRVLNVNFHRGDLLLTLTFDPAHLDACGGTLEGAKREAKKFLDRVSYRLKKAGKTCKWIVVPSEIDGETGKLVRPHVHLVISGDGFSWKEGKLFLLDEEVEAKIWRQGTVDNRPLRRQDDYYGLAKYLVDQARNVPDEKKWSCSRNMEKPIIRREIVTSGRQLRVPTGAVELPGTCYDPERDQNVVRYVAKPKEARTKLGGHKELARAMAAEAATGGEDDGI